MGIGKYGSENRVRQTGKVIVLRDREMTRALTAPLLVRNNSGNGATPQTALLI